MAKSKAKSAAKQQGKAQEAAIGVSARAYLSRGNSSTLASVTVDLGGEYAIRGVRVVQGRNGPFVSMPQQKDGKGEYRDVVFPVTREARERLIDTVMDAYEQALEQTAKQSEEPEQAGPTMTM